MSNIKINDLSSRVELILDEQNLKASEFARDMGVSEPYVSQLRSGKCSNVSRTFALLVQERYGYRYEWLLKGDEPRRIPDMSFKKNLDNETNREMESLANRVKELESIVFRLISKLEGQ